MHTMRKCLFRSSWKWSCDHGRQCAPTNYDEIVVSVPASTFIGTILAARIYGVFGSDETNSNFVHTDGDDISDLCF